MAQTTKQEQDVRRVAAEALDGLAFALAMAGLVVLAGLVVTWVSDPERGFPGRYLILAGASLVSALVLNIRADRIRKAA